MSQFFQGTTAGSLPPTVPTSFVTDDGTAIPALNILNIDGLDSIENNNNGIFTRANPDLSNNLEVILSNRISVTTTTSDGAGQTQTVTLMTPANGTAQNFEAVFIAYDAINDEGGGGDQQGLSRKSGGTVSIINVSDSFDQSDPGLIAIDWNVIASGSDLVAEVTGVAGRRITWTVTFKYDQTP